MTDEDGLQAPLLIIDNCEAPSEWLFIEYRHCTELWKPLVFAGVGDRGFRKRLEPLAPAVPERAAGVCPEGGALVLDPRAESPLVTADFDAAACVVVGGILGDEKFTGKTGRLVTGTFGGRAVARHLGRIQLPTDVAVFVARAVLLGACLDEIELTTEVEIVHDDGHSTVLPYGYPLVEGKVLLTPGLTEYLRTH